MTVISTTLDLLRRPTEEITSEGYSAEQKTPCVPTCSATAVLSWRHEHTHGRSSCMANPISVGWHAVKTDLDTRPRCHQGTSRGTGFWDGKQVDTGLVLLRWSRILLNTMNAGEPDYWVMSSYSLETSLKPRVQYPLCGLWTCHDLSSTLVSSFCRLKTSLPFKTEGASPPGSFS